MCIPLKFEKHSFREPQLTFACSCEIHCLHLQSMSPETASNPRKFPRGHSHFGHVYKGKMSRRKRGLDEGLGMMTVVGNATVITQRQLSPFPACCLWCWDSLRSQNSLLIPELVKQLGYRMSFAQGDAFWKLSKFL